MNEICDYLLEWTVKQFNEQTIEQTKHVCSSEIYDRAVSVIGIIVPVSLWLLCIAALFLLLFGFFRLFRGEK